MLVSSIYAITIAIEETKWALAKIEELMIPLSNGFLLRME
jgi:hypothetical protein